MVDPVRQLAEITKIIIDTSSVLSARGGELLTALIDQLPPGEEPSPLTVDASEDTSDATRMTVLLAWDNSGTGANVKIDWGVPDVVDDDEPPTGTMTYQYEAAGTFTITITDLEDETRTASVDVTVPFGDVEPELPIVTVIENTTDVSRMTVDVTVDNFGVGPVTLNFGDGSPVAENPGDNAGVTTRQFGAAGTFTVTATDVADPTRVGTVDVTVPFTGTPVAARRARRR